MFTVVT